MRLSPQALVAGVAFALAASLAAGCAGRPGSGRSGAAADSSFAAITASHGRTPLELSLAGGKATYEHYCLICHGESGGGDGFNAYNVKAAFGVSPVAFSDSAAVAGLRDADALKAIRDGGPAVGKSAAMPPWGHTLTPDEIAGVWRYARSLGAAPGH